MKRIFVIFIIVILSILAFLAIQSRNNNEVIAPTTDQIQIPQGYKKYSDLGFTIYHSPNMLVRKEGDGIAAFVLIGPSQKGQTEMYDGINITIFKVETYTQDNFKSFVEKEVEKIKNDGMSEITKGITPIQIGKYRGLKFTVHGFGEHEEVYLEGNDKKYLHIATLVEDPTNQEFEEMKNKILETIEF